MSEALTPLAHGHQQQGCTAIQMHRVKTDPNLHKLNGAQLKGPIQSIRVNKMLAIDTQFVHDIVLAVERIVLALPVVNFSLPHSLSV